VQSTAIPKELLGISGFLAAKSLLDDGQGHVDAPGGSRKTQSVNQ